METHLFPYDIRTFHQAEFGHNQSVLLGHSSEKGAGIGGIAISDEIVHHYRGIDHVYCHSAIPILTQQISH
jgi:hypothetical protein